MKYLLIAVIFFTPFFSHAQCVFDWGRIYTDCQSPDSNFYMELNKYVVSKAAKDIFNVFVSDKTTIEYAMVFGGSKVATSGPYRLFRAGYGFHITGPKEKLKSYIDYAIDNRRRLMRKARRK